MVLARCKTRVSTAAIVQFVAIMILQSYFLLPLYRQLHLDHNTAIVCQHDHTLCGCSPARIASKSCCCFRTAPSCCQSKPRKETHDARVHDTSHDTHAVSTAPCGGDSEPGVVSPETLKFISQSAAFLPISFTSIAYGQATETRVPGRSLEPPDPPPRHASAS